PTLTRPEAPVSKEQQEQQNQQMGLMGPVEQPGLQPTVLGEAVLYEMVRIDKELYGPFKKQLDRINKVIVKADIMSHDDLKASGINEAIKVLTKVASQMKDSEIEKLLDKRANKKTKKSD